MGEQQIYYKKVIKMINKRFIIAVAVLILGILARQVIIAYVMNHNEHMASIINIAGRQRMHGQRIAKDILAIYELGDVEAAKVYVEELRETVEISETIHTALQQGDIIKGGSISNSKFINDLFAEIDDNHHIIMKYSNEIIIMLDGDHYDEAAFKEKINFILENEEVYLEGMERIVNQYEMEVKGREHRLGELEIILFIIILAVIAFEVIAIFIPAQMALFRAVEDITESSSSLWMLIQSVNEELLLLDANTLEIIFLNEMAQQLLEITDDKKRYFTDEIEWGEDSSLDIPKLIREEEKIKGIEVSIIKKSGETRYYKLSTVKGTYRRKKAVLIVLADITSQKRDEETIRKQAIKDELTGLYNRHFLDQILVEELDRADRYNYPLSVFIMDLDFFKRVNDTWGHPIGDVILKLTAELTLKNTRKSDYFIRFGGEEFLLFMPHIDLKQAVQVAEKVRREIEQYTHPIVGKYTASFGVAERQRGENFLSLYHRADSALYLAKQEGRNRVVADMQQVLTNNNILHTVWRDEWNSGNVTIDHQHKELLNMINELTNLSLSDVGDTIINNKIGLMIQFTAEHFETEEKILQQLGYPYYKKHAHVHTNLLLCIKEMEEEYLAGKIKLTAFFAFLLDEVIVGHLLDMDTEFFSYVKETHRA